MQEPALVGERLTLSAFTQLSGTLGGYRFVKLVVDRETGLIHFMDSRENLFHVKYIAAHVLHMPPDELERRLDEMNFEVYHREDRRFCLGILALHQQKFFSLETVEADTMTAQMLQYLYDEVRANVDQSVPILLKPANHLQESHVANIPKDVLPRILSYELFSTNAFVPLNPGTAEGRLRVFRTAQEYEENQLAWHDIIVMARVPDDIPRLTGVVNAEHTTPLSHTNVLASGWGIPNAIQLGALDDLAHLNGRWVRYTVDPNATEIGIEPIEQPHTDKPAWLATRVTMDEPDLCSDRIASLSDLRWRDSTRYGTKAANLGELNEVARNGSTRWLGFYRIPRPPRENLLPYLEQLLGTDDLDEGAKALFKNHIRIPRGIALPFSLHQRFLEASPRIQQAIGKLKLDTCGTHTEIKLGRDGTLTLIETGARFGGVMITREVEEVFGIDPIGMLVDQLLGREVFYPAQLLVTAGRAAASVAVIPTNAQGEPWRTQPLWRPDDVDWSTIVTPGTHLEEIPAFSMPVGEPVPVYDPSGGSRNWLGLFVVTAPDAHQLHRDCHAILNGLEAGLNSVRTDR